MFTTDDFKMGGGARGKKAKKAPKFNQNYPLEPESLEFLALCLMQDTFMHYIRNDISSAITVKMVANYRSLRLVQSL